MTNSRACLPQCTCCSKEAGVQALVYVGIQLRIADRCVFPQAAAHRAFQVAACTGAATQSISGCPAVAIMPQLLRSHLQLLFCLPLLCRTCPALLAWCCPRGAVQQIYNLSSLLGCVLPPLSKLLLLLLLLLLLGRLLLLRRWRRRRLLLLRLLLLRLLPALSARLWLLLPPLLLARLWLLLH